MTFLNKPPLGAQLDFAHPLNKGVVGFWLLNEGHGDKVYDLSMNGNTGTLTNMAFPPTPSSGWNPGRNGVGLQFDGVNDYVNAVYSSSLDFSGKDKFTIEAWAKLAEVKSEILVDDRQKFLQIGSDGKLVAGGYIGGAWNYISGIGTTIQVGVWQHLVVTYDGSSIKIYYNGNLDGTKAQTGTLGYGDPDHNSYIGKWSGGDFLNGTIDEVRIWNRALPADEIQANYYTRLQELKITAIGNGTASNNWNSTTNNPLSIPVSSGDTITGLSYTIPSSVYQDGVTVYDYHNSTKWNISTTGSYTEDTTTVADTCGSGTCTMNVSKLHTVSGTGNITVLLNSIWRNAPIKYNVNLTSTNNPSATVTNNTTHAVINEGSVDNTTTYTYGLTYLYVDSTEPFIYLQSIINILNVIVGNATSGITGWTFSILTIFMHPPLIYLIAIIMFIIIIFQIASLIIIRGKR